ncbi:hypothetical protein [Pantoea sp. 18069]|uniref:hypothetical protein n=1 Tax=Pantoea sp. 18069 TaxID=2681415 RepID=UPI001358BE5F|nr:hypothetical protein [Pantoea sp. 18069]
MIRNAPGRLRYALVRPPSALGWGLFAIAVLGAAVLLLWALQGTGARPWPAALGLLLWLAVGAGARRCWRHWPEGLLEWDGDQWWLQCRRGARPLALPEAPQVCWDGQEFLLLRAPGSLPGGRWLWLHRASAPALWGDLRRTVYWRPRPARSA